MKPSMVVVVMLNVGIVASPTATQRQTGASAIDALSAWWQSEKLQTELGLSEEQSTTLEHIFEKAGPSLRKLMKNLNQEQETLSGLIRAVESDEWEVMLQIDQVEAARSALGKARTLMLYRMHGELSSAQREALRKRFGERNRRGRRYQPQSR